ncbi:MAG: hypothetical protein AUI93_04960 [Crenarchaeota archaeon 13_1_40CM_3_52_10]|nr:MAG: hypothetical protein AUI93_04960 [Crenarchaeota archaeon 13_1_40CM_3_52_10]
MRMKTDIEIPIVRLLLPLASYLLWAVFAVAWWSTGASEIVGNGISASILINPTPFVAGLGVLGLAASAAAAYVVFTLVNRGNEHSSRTRALLLEALSALETRAGPSSSQTLLPLNSAEEGFYNLVRGEREKSAVLWALLSSIPFVGWAFLAVAQWRLSRDLAKHSRLEGLVFEDVDRTFRTVGTRGMSVKHAPMHSHDALGVTIVVVSIIELLSSAVLGFVGSLVLIYLTVGMFSLFWIDLSMMDPTGHFHYHSQVEADMLRALQDTAIVNSGVA